MKKVKNKQVDKTMSKTSPPFCIGLTALFLVIFTAGAFGQKEAPPASGPPKPFIFPNQENYTLSNGLRVTLIPYGSVPKVAFQAVIQTGSLNEKPEKRWISDITASMLKEGTTTCTGADLALETAEMGGSVNTSADNDNSTVNGEVLSEFDVRFLNLLADVLMNPNFKPEDLERLRDSKLRQIAIAKTQAGSIAWEKFRQVIFPDHPYGVINPSEETVKGYTLDDAKSYYNDNYGAARTHLYICGQFDTPALKTAVEKTLGKWKKGPAAIRNAPAISAHHSLSLIDRPNAPQSTIFLGMPAPSPSDADYVKMTVLDALLGGAFASRITANIREDKGYTYSPGSFVWNRYKTGYWLENADVTTDFTGASIREILYEIERLQKESPGETELQGIKNYLVGAYVLNNSSRFGIIGQIENVDDNELDKNYLDNYLQKVIAVTPQDISAMAKKYLQPDKMTIVVVGDKAKVAEQLKAYE